MSATTFTAGCARVRFAGGGTMSIAVAANVERRASIGGHRHRKNTDCGLLYSHGRVSAIGGKQTTSVRFATR